MGEITQIIIIKIKLGFCCCCFFLLFFFLGGGGDFKNIKKKLL